MKEGEPPRKKAIEAKWGRRWSKLLISDRLFRVLAFDPGFFRGVGRRVGTDDTGALCSQTDRGADDVEGDGGNMCGE